ncbi:uncharacterized protein LOC133313951 [Gastrolobium bilobum]|uniref:uncharacterized protein LOC133313951 n=1 Tax=Gastrolobium bilobum TaxID=150636 RepID=UPI002AB2EE1C|nr:uncharacterized protein LOC133313951 [Gastrolobium bilobum]
MAKTDEQNTTRTSIMEQKHMHQLHRIAGTPTHKLFLKKWLKEEELIHGSIVLKETQIESVVDPITVLSLGIIWAIRYKSDVEVHMKKMLQREKEDKGMLGKCVENEV